MVSGINNQELIEEYKKLIEQANGAETNWIDFKSEPYNNQEKSLDSLRTDVVAFGNYKGGIILIGVQKDNRTMSGFELKNPNINEIKDNILNTLSNKIFPIIPRNKEEDIDIDHAVLADSRYVMRIAIKQFNQLRIVQLSDKRFSIPCRNNNQISHLGLDQVDLTLKRKTSLSKESSKLSPQDREFARSILSAFLTAKKEMSIILELGTVQEKMRRCDWQEGHWRQLYSHRNKFASTFVGQKWDKYFDTFMNIFENLKKKVQEYIALEKRLSRGHVDLNPQLTAISMDIYSSTGEQNKFLKQLDEIIQKLEELLVETE